MALKKSKKTKGAGKAVKGNSSTKSNDQLYVTEMNPSWATAALDNPSRYSFEWVTKSDTVYGYISPSPYSPPNQDPRKIFGAEPAAPVSSYGSPYSLQWEMEFSRDKIIGTYAGNDADTQKDPEYYRTIYSGSFSYKDGLVTGSVDSICYAQLESQTFASYASGAQADRTVLPVEEIKIYRSSSPIAFSGFSDLKQKATTANPAFQQVAQYQSAPPDGYSAVAPTDRSIVSQYGLTPLLQEGWWLNPLTSNLV